MPQRGDITTACPPHITPVKSGEVINREMHPHSPNLPIYQPPTGGTRRPNTTTTPQEHPAPPHLRKHPPPLHCDNLSLRSPGPSGPGRLLSGPDTVSILIINIRQQKKRRLEKRQPRPTNAKPWTPSPETAPGTATSHRKRRCGIPRDPNIRKWGTERNKILDKRLLKKRRRPGPQGEPRLLPCCFVCMCPRGGMPSIREVCGGTRPRSVFPSQP